ncbi:MAG: FAD-dependent oxidoreductase [Elusimicrobia bacterium]|nr:FAD-dependent oxidoreductase [Elusimicrobiota bacterium]
METKIGAYFCKGCGIGGCLDIDKLLKAATAAKVPVVKSHDILCSQAGVDSIKADIAGAGVNRVSVVACSPRVFPELFEFGKDVLTDRVNVREGVAWCCKPNDEDTQMLAEDCVRMSVARLVNSAPAEPFVEETSKAVLVVGAGMAGLTAAKSAAQAGYKVVLVEKEERLGGWASKFSKVVPKGPVYREPEDSGVEALVQEVESHPNIKVHKGATVAKTVGQPGKFMAALEKGGVTTEVTVGSIVLASGWKPYDASKLGRWGYGASPDVITNVRFEELAAKGRIMRPSDGKPVTSVAFIQCAGSRDAEHLPYCSAVCCRVSLKQALHVRREHPEAKVYIIYKDLRSPAQYERFYARVAEDEGVFLTKGEIAEVKKEADGLISVRAEKTLLGEDITVRADLVVLATGMVPSTKVEPGPAAAEGAAGKTCDPEKEGKTADGKKEAESAELGAKILNLTYRQGTDLPTLKYGFPDSHFICFPYETRRTGIYAAGAVRAPMDLASGAGDGRGAALKAIQCVEAISRGAAVHPRAGDLSYPEFFMQRCTQCKRCTEECPFGSLDEDNKGTPLPNPLRCRRCGVCLGACPERIVSFKNFNVNMVSKMIKAIEVPEEDEDKPRILAFICENDALASLDMAGVMRLQRNAMIRIIPLRCLGSMNAVWVSDALAGGIDGVLLIGCKKGDDYQCHFIRGSELADYRMGNVKEKLKQLVLEEERVEIHELAITDYRRIPEIFDKFLETIRRVGPNPYKDM